MIAFVGDVAEWIKEELLPFLSQRKEAFRAVATARTRLACASDNTKYIGDVAEWLKATVSKTVVRETVP